MVTAAAQARALERPASLVRQAAGRLATMTEAQRAEVIALLGIQVAPLDEGREPALRIQGNVCDVTMLSGGHATDGDASSTEV
jgi:hypothetical protein